MTGSAPAPRAPGPGAWAFRGADGLAVLVIVAFVGIGLCGLGTYPIVDEDEPWIAAHGYGFWPAGGVATGLVLARPLRQRAPLLVLHAVVLAVRGGLPLAVRPGALPVAPGLVGLRRGRAVPHPSARPHPVLGPPRPDGCLRPGLVADRSARA